MKMKSKDIYIVVSFMTTKFTLLKQHWAKHTQSKSETSFDTDRGLPPHLGGKLIILNWITKKIVWDIDVDIPSGIFLDTELLFVNSFKNEILGISPNGKIEYCLRHSKFNALRVQGLILYLKLILLAKKYLNGGQQIVALIKRPPEISERLIRPTTTQRKFTLPLNKPPTLTL